MIGLVNTGIDFGVFTFTYYYLGWHILVANPIAWLMAVSNSYVLNSMITFAAETGRRLSVKAYITFILTQAGGLIANTTTVFALSYFMSAWMAKIPAIGAPNRRPCMSKARPSQRGMSSRCPVSMKPVICPHT